MSSKRQLRRKRCGNKTRHASQAAALAHIFSLVHGGKAGNRLMTPYRCPFCHSWHVGHTQEAR